MVLSSQRIFTKVVPQSGQFCLVHIFGFFHDALLEIALITKKRAERILRFGKMARFRQKGDLLQFLLDATAGALLPDLRALHNMMKLPFGRARPELT